MKNKELNDSVYFEVHKNTVIILHKKILSKPFVLHCLSHKLSFTAKVKIQKVQIDVLIFYPEYFLVIVAWLNYDELKFTFKLPLLHYRCLRISF